MKRRLTRHVLSDLNLTIQATVSLPAEVSWDLRYTVSKKKYLSVTSKKYFASCSAPKDNLQGSSPRKLVMLHNENSAPEIPPREGVNAKKDGLVYAFRFTSATESYLAAVMDSI